MDRAKRVAVVQTIFLLVIVLAADMVTGGIAIASSPTAISGCNNPSSLEQCGTANCTISGSGTPGSQACVATVTFPVAFAAVPTFATATFAGFNGGVNHSEKSIPSFSKSFESDNGETWTAFPAASTELYGDINHEVPVDAEVQLATAASFHATCIASAGVQTGTETLRPQYFDTGTGTWKELAVNTGALDLPVGSAFCGVSGSDAIQIGPVSFDPHLTAVFPTLFRVVGFGGGGVGDSMSFNEIHLVFYVLTLVTPILCIPVVTACPNGLGQAAGFSKTSMVIVAEIPFPQPVSDFKVQMNWIAKE